MTGFTYLEEKSQEYPEDFRPPTTPGNQRLCWEQNTQGSRVLEAYWGYRRTLNNAVLLDAQAVLGEPRLEPKPETRASK